MLGHDSTPIYLCPQDDYHPGNDLWFRWTVECYRVAGRDFPREGNEIFIVSRILSSWISSQRKVKR